MTCVLQWTHGSLITQALPQAIRYSQSLRRSCGRRRLPKVSERIWRRGSGRRRRREVQDRENRRSRESASRKATRKARKQHGGGRGRRDYDKPAMTIVPEKRPATCGRVDGPARASGAGNRERADQALHLRFKSEWGLLPRTPQCGGRVAHKMNVGRRIGFLLGCGHDMTWIPGSFEVLIEPIRPGSTDPVIRGEIVRN